MPIIVNPGDTPTPTPVEGRYGASELVEEALQELSGHTADQGKVTTLAAPMTASDTAFTVSESGQVSRGLVEIDNELMYVATSVDGECTVLPGRGRGWGSSAPAAHETDALVTMSPRFPRHTILQRINDVLGNIWPQLYGSGETTFPFEATVITFPLPADAEEVLGVEWDPVGPQHSWVPISTYTFNRQANPAEFPTGRSIDLPQGLTPGRTVRVRYMKRPSTITLEDSFTDSGLETSAWPAVMYGALHRLASSLPLGQADVQTASAREFSRTRSLDITQLAEYFRGLHELEVEKERRRLQEANPIRISFGS